MIERYEFIKVAINSDGEMLITFMAVNDGWETHRLSIGQARLLAQDIIAASLVKPPNLAMPGRASVNDVRRDTGLPPVERAATPKTEIVDIHTLRREMQQLARSLQDVAQRVNRLECTPTVTMKDVDEVRMARQDLANAMRQPLRTAYDTGSTP